MRELSNLECFFTSGGNQTASITTDSSKILTEEGVALVAALGLVGGGYLGSVSWAAHPIMGALAGAATGSFLPVVFTLACRAWIKLNEITGVI